MTKAELEKENEKLKHKIKRLEKKLLWSKEAKINKAIANLPPSYSDDGFNSLRDDGRMSSMPYQLNDPRFGGSRGDTY